MGSQPPEAEEVDVLIKGSQHHSLRLLKTTHAPWANQFRTTKLLKLTTPLTYYYYKQPLQYHIINYNEEDCYLLLVIFLLLLISLSLKRTILEAINCVQQYFVVPKWQPKLR